MTRRAVITASRALLVAFLATMMAVPTFASRCAGCVAADGKCSHCSTMLGESYETPSHTAGRTCCQHRESQSPTATGDDAVCNKPPQRAPCACYEQPQQRTLPNDRTSQDWQPTLLTVLPPAAFLPIDVHTDGELAIAAWLASLSPPVPHRILHCAWLI